MSDVANLYVAGTWRGAADDGTLDVLNPADESVIGTVAAATSTDVGAAVTAAVAAQQAWARVPIVERGDALRRLADLIEADTDRFARLLVTEVGKPLPEALAEVGFAVEFLRYNARWDRILSGDILAGDSPGEVIHLLRVPLGVVAAICPWNFPLAVLCRKLAPALLTGNTVVVKPSEVTPLTALELVRLVDEHLDLPAGTVNLVSGGPAVGAELVANPGIAMVSFTGHRDTGKAVMRSAADNLTRVALELGGKAPAIVLRDADLDVAVPAILRARHTNSGQVCTSAERVLVHRDLVEPFVERYVAAAEALVVGNPSGTVDMGPMASAAQVTKTSTAVERAVKEGASLRTGGGQPEGAAYDAGYWFAPTVLTDVPRDAAILREETFGPVTPIVPIDTLEDALTVANDSRYGLSAYVFSTDYSSVMRTVDELQFGEIYVNRTLGESVHAHHAGLKESGIGGEDGKWGILKYTHVKTAYHRYG
ncbi:aldehyde dehydrogenase family protein [Intrasporangium mesophilum]